MSLGYFYCFTPHENSHGERLPNTSLDIPQFYQHFRLSSLLPFFLTIVYFDSPHTSSRLILVKLCVMRKHSEFLSSFLNQPHTCVRKSVHKRETVVRVVSREDRGEQKSLITYYSFTYVGFQIPYVRRQVIIL